MNVSVRFTRKNNNQLNVFLNGSGNPTFIVGSYDDRNSPEEVERIFWLIKSYIDAHMPEASYDTVRLGNTIEEQLKHAITEIPFVSNQPQVIQDHKGRFNQAPIGLSAMPSKPDATDLNDDESAAEISPPKLDLENVKKVVKAPKAPKAPKEKKTKPE